MNLEASPGHVVLKIYHPPTNSKLIMPDNVAMQECPTFEIVSVGDGRTSQYGFKETIPYKKGERVVVAGGRCMPVESGGEKFYIVEWSSIFAKVFEG